MQENTKGEATAAALPSPPHFVSHSCFPITQGLLGQSSVVRTQRSAGTSDLGPSCILASPHQCPLSASAQALCIPVVQATHLYSPPTALRDHQRQGGTVSLPAPTPSLRILRANSRGVEAHGGKDTKLQPLETMFGC